MPTLRWDPLLLPPPAAHRLLPPLETKRSNLSHLINHHRPLFPTSRTLRISNPPRTPPITRAGFAPPLPVAAPEDADVFFSETFSLKRVRMVEGKVTVKFSREGEGWRLAVGCDLEGKWLLHWGVTYCDDFGGEWDQPPPEMRPPGSVPIKDYAIETPLKKSPSASEGQILHEVHVDIDSTSTIAAIHFVLKDDETGAWFQHKGRDFRIPLKGDLEEYEVAGGNQGFSIWPGAILMNFAIFIGLLANPSPWIMFWMAKIDQNSVGQAWVTSMPPIFKSFNFFQHLVILQYLLP